MTIARIFLDAALVPGERVPLAADRVHYLARVLRLASGATVMVFNGRDGEFLALIEELTTKRGQLRVGEPTHSQCESPLQTWLVQGLCRGQRMDYCVQKATELGVTRIVPVTTARGVVRIPAAKTAGRIAHWRAIAIGACEQSRRTRVPQIEPPQGLREFLARDDRPSLAFLDPDAGVGVADWQVADNASALLVGPEGGFSQDESLAIAATGAARWRMGPRILRTETAGVVALALLQSRFGDLA